MTVAGGTCTHSVRVSDRDAYRTDDFPAGSLTDDEVWHCPHDARDGGEECLFHAPLAEKRDRDVVAAFVDALEETAAGTGDLDGRRRTEFVDAVFGRVEWPAETALGDDGQPDPVYLTHVTFAGEVDFAGCRFERGVFFTGSTFAGRATFSEATFAGDTRFNGVTFEADAAFDRATFRTEVRSGGVTFEGDADFYRATFEDDFNAKYATFAGTATFWKASIRETARFNHADFRPLDGEFHAMQELDLSNANFTEATLRDVNLEASELNRTKLFGADLRGSRLHGAVLTESRIDDRTRFLGDPDAAQFSVDSLCRFWETPRCVYDPHYAGESYGDDTTVQRNRAKSTYRAIETVAGAASRPGLQSRCFVDRQDVHRRSYRDAVLRGLDDPGSGDGTAWKRSSPRDRGVAAVRDGLYRFVSLFQWGRAELSRWTLLYGESPWRVIATGIALVVGFALLYPLGGLQSSTGPAVTYATVAERPNLLFDSVYFSTLTFTTLGMGEFQPVGFARVLMTVQSALGAVVVALLVFVFGRRAAR